MRTADSTAARASVATAAPRPELQFALGAPRAIRFAAAPTLGLSLHVESSNRVPVRSILLNVQVRIAVAHRAYDPETRVRLVELFGTPEQWERSARSLLWTHAVVLIPAFADHVAVDVPIPCTYDFETAAAKYFHTVDDGDVPIELLFSGTVFYDDEHGALATCLVPWDRSATAMLPIAVWKEMMNHYFPDAAWLRLRRDVFDQLYAFRARRALPTWEAALEALLETQRAP